MKSAAVVNFAPEKGAVEIREIEKPLIGPEDVLLAVVNVGVCGSDLHQWTADHSWPVKHPVVLGHEFGGHLVLSDGEALRERKWHWSGSSRIGKVGWGPLPLGFNLDPLVQKNVTPQGSFSHNWPIWERVLALLTSGQLDVKPIIGGIWPIDQWHEAVEKNV